MGDWHMIPSSSRDAILKWMDDFDRDLRGASEWRGWQEKASYRYAVERNGNHYPVKKIISMATGAPESNFSAGSEANGFLEKLGFVVTPLRNRFNGWCIY